ncbi:MAG: histidine kinase [Bacteroidota bacterium]
MKAVVFILAYMLSTAMYAQQPYFTVLNDTKGLPSNNVYNILQDKKGYIWIASQEGISRYDGYNLKTYKNTNQTSAAGSNLKEDVLGRIWYQNFDGYCYYIENDSLHALKQNKPIGFFAFGITNNYLFLLQYKGIDVYNINTLQLIKTIPFFSAIKDINNTACFNNNYYFTANKVLYKITSNLKLEATRVQIASNEKNNQIYATNKNLVLTARENENEQLYFIENGKLQPTSKIGGPKLIQNLHLIDNDYWVLAPNGAYVFGKNGFKHYFKNQSISCVIKDRDNNYWVSSVNKGIFIIPSLQTTFVAIENYVPSLFEKTKGGYLLFTQNNEVVALNNNFEPHKKLFTNPSNASIYYTYYDSSLDVLLTSSFGTGIFNSKPFGFIKHEDFALKSIAKIDHKYYALATSGYANLVISPNANKNIPSKWDDFYNKKLKEGNGDASDFISSIRAKTVAYSPSQNAIYCGSNIGLHKQTIYNQTEIKQNNQSVFVSKLIAFKSFILALTTKGELITITNDTLFNTLNSLPNIDIKEVKKIKAFGNYLCILGNDKFIIVNTENIHKTIYQLSIQLKTSEINDFILEQNQLHILTHNNIISVAVNGINKLEVKPNFVIENYEVNGKQYATINESFSYQENNIIINYALLNYAQFQHQNIAYKINNENWVNTMPNMRSLQFASLSPGNYTIQFKVNNTVLTNVVVKFKINKPFWLQWWFLLLIVSILTISGLGYYKWQISLLVKKNKLITEKMALENELNKSKLTSIKSQMNPHFFYNALNTIQSYIFINDKKNANNYLSKFSKLTRMILEMSEKETITIGEEIEALNLYLALEQMRFEDDFYFEIKISVDLDKEMDKIPPMLVQPYVENAIKHGLLHKDGKKNLSVLFDCIENNLMVTINDNGVGRKRSEQLNKIKDSKHQSFSTQANKKRLEILNQSKNKPVAVIITDNYNEIGNATGTTVTLTIPLT